MRAAELTLALVTLNGRDGRFMGIGGDDRWKACLLAWRFDAEESVDMPECTCFTVQRDNSRQLPLFDGSFAVLFSFQVM